MIQQISFFLDIDSVIGNAADKIKKGAGEMFKKD